MKISILSSLATTFALQVHSGLEADDTWLGSCQGFNISELTISTTHALYLDAKLTPFQLTECYLARIHALNPTLKAVLELNPHALDYARTLSTNVSNKPLFGIPVLVKGSFGVKHLKSSAGAAALEYNLRDDANVVRKLREAGAIVLGTTNLSELSRLRSYDAPEGWSQLGGQTLNPYNLNETTSGSSSGSAVAIAASLALVSFGTETLGSTLSPASRAMVIGFKPTYNWTSVEGIVPLAPTLDTVGIFAKTVCDASIVFKAITNSQAECRTTLPKKIGIINPLENEVMVSKLKTAATNFRSNGQVVGEVVFDGEVDFDAVFYTILTEFKHHINKYLSSNKNISSLQDLIDFNSKQKGTYPQELLEAANEAGDITDDLHIANWTRITTTFRGEFEEFMASKGLDAIMVSSNPSDFDIVIPDLIGFPAISVPSGLDSDSTPQGIAVYARRGQECLILALAEILEKESTFQRVPPKFLLTPDLAFIAVNQTPQ